MLVVALLRPVDLRTEVDPLTGVVTRDARVAALPPSDAAALEHALELGSAWGARVLALSAGGPECDEPLREALARGAQVRRVHLHEPYVDDLVRDEQHLARALVAAIGERPDLVLCGDRSADRGTARPRGPSG